MSTCTVTTSGVAAVAGGVLRGQQRLGQRHQGVGVALVSATRPCGGAFGEDSSTTTSAILALRASVSLPGTLAPVQSGTGAPPEHGPAPRQLAPVRKRLVDVDEAATTSRRLSGEVAERYAIAITG